MKKIDYFIEKYLENRPMFLAVIRTPEAILFQKYSNLIKKPSLDFGCGDGFFAKTVFGKDYIDLGLDVKNERTEKMIDKKIYKKVIFYDGKKLPFKDNYSQTIVSNCVLEHIPNVVFSLKEIYRVLKPGGYFITTVMTEKWNEYLFGKKIFGNWYVEYMKKKQLHHNLFSCKKWANVFKQTGFKVIKSYGYLNKKNSRFMDLAHYLSFPSLLSYRFFHNWQLFPKLTNLLWQPRIHKNISIDVKTNESSTLFFVLKK